MPAIKLETKPLHRHATTRLSESEFQTLADYAKFSNQSLSMLMRQAVRAHLISLSTKAEPPDST